MLTLRKNFRQVAKSHVVCVNIYVAVSPESTHSLELIITFLKGKLEFESVVFIQKRTDF